MAGLIIPYKPREQFKPFHDRKERFSCIVAHRRAGKTVACINDLIRGALKCKLSKPRFAYIAPHYNQAKDVAWEYVKEYAAPVLQHYGIAPNESELRIDLPNEGRVRLYGADNYDRLRGLYFDGVILDEYATMDPRIWEVIRPTLSDRNGWCVWIGTPAGHNSFYHRWQEATTNKDYQALMLKASETGIIDQTELDAVKRDMTDGQYQQEYECSFEAAIQGAYFAKEFGFLDSEDRIRSIPWERDVDVVTAWDLGIGDSTSIWFCQQVGSEVRIIDYYDASGVGLDHYVKHLREKPYIYGEHLLPHDVEVRELGTGRSRKETLEGLGMRVSVVPKLPVDDGINAARALLSKCWFDSTKCHTGIEALKQYRTEFDEKRKTFKNSPLHDWTSHAADAFRYLAVGMPRRNIEAMPEINTDWVT